jgi:hypothetical protein
MIKIYKSIGNLLWFILLVHFILFGFIIAPRSGTGFKNSTYISRAFIVSPSIVYEDQDQYILLSKNLNSVYLFDGEGSLENIYTFPTWGVIGVYYENETLYAFAYRDHTRWIVYEDDIVEERDYTPTTSEMERFEHPYSGSSTVRLDLLKRVSINTANQQIPMETNYLLNVVYSVFFVIIVTIGIVTHSENYILEHKKAGTYRTIYDVSISKNQKLILLLVVIVLSYFSRFFLLTLLLPIINVMPSEYVKEQ